MLLTGKWVKTELKEEMKDILKLNKNVYTMYVNFWDTVKTVIRNKFIALSIYLKTTTTTATKMGRPHTSNLTAHL